MTKENISVAQSDIYDKQKKGILGLVVKEEFAFGPSEFPEEALLTVTTKYALHIWA